MCYMLVTLKEGICQPNDITGWSFLSKVSVFPAKEELKMFTVVPCILMSFKSFIYQLMHNRATLNEY
jgi:hypothetical protein